ncbi:MAG: SPOR domain-containing protein [Porphyromonas sp.]|nr:SPOR domain-containing protein [Porphyromonas sp.]
MSKKAFLSLQYAHKVVTMVVAFLGVHAITQAQNVVTNDQSTLPSSIFEVLGSSKPGEGKVIVFVPDEVRTRVGSVHSQYGQSLRGESNISLRSGYRVQVYVGNLKDSKHEAYSRAARINHVFPEQICYVTYKAPFWKLLVGDFLSHEEAYSLAKSIKRSMPDMAHEIYVVKNRIRHYN